MLIVSSTSPIKLNLKVAPGSVLDGYMGTTTASIRIETGDPVLLNDIVDPGVDYWISRISNDGNWRF